MVSNVGLWKVTAFTAATSKIELKSDKVYKFDCLNCGENTEFSGNFVGNTAEYIPCNSCFSWNQLSKDGVSVSRFEAYQPIVSLENIDFDVAEFICKTEKCNKSFHPKISESKDGIRFFWCIYCKTVYKDSTLH